MDWLVADIEERVKTVKGRNNSLEIVFGVPEFSSSSLVRLRCEEHLRTKQPHHPYNLAGNEVEAPLRIWRGDRWVKERKKPSSKIARDVPNMYD